MILTFWGEKFAVDDPGTANLSIDLVIDKFAIRKDLGGPYPLLTAEDLQSLSELEVVLRFAVDSGDSLIDDAREWGVINNVDVRSCEQPQTSVLADFDDMRLYISSVRKCEEMKEIVSCLFSMASCRGDRFFRCTLSPASLCRANESVSLIPTRDEFLSGAYPTLLEDQIKIGFAVGEPIPRNVPSIRIDY